MMPWVPDWFRRWYLCSDFYIRYRSTYRNLLHCTVQKSASQWIRTILADERTYRFSGLQPHRYQDRLPGGFDARPLHQRRFTEPFPSATVLSPLYIDFAGWNSIPKPDQTATFFVMRDPRDVVVSWYFSSKFSHRLVGDLERVRQDLSRLSDADGLLYAIEYLHEFGLFAAQRSWAGADAVDASILLMRYEDLIGEHSRAEFERLLAHADIRMPAAVLDEVLRSHSFESRSGRKPGQEDVTAHERKGVAGDWRNHFTPVVETRFAAVAGDVIQQWGYS